MSAESNKLTFYTAVNADWYYQRKLNYELNKDACATKQCNSKNNIMPFCQCTIKYI